jgi:hypothetical protein
MKKLHSSRTEIFSNRIRTKTVMPAYQGKLGLGFRRQSIRVRLLRDREAEQHPVPPSSRKTGSLLSCRRKPLSWLAERFRFRPYTPQRRSCPRKMYPWRSGTMTASRGLKLKAARLQSSVGCCLFSCSVVHLYLCYQAGIYFVLLKHKFKVHEHLTNNATEI